MADINDVFLANPLTEVKREDLLYVGSDPGGTPADGAIAALALLGGWIGVRDAWTYASANTINVPAGATSLYQKGWGIRWKQGGSYKYASITTVASALLTVYGGTDYTVANSAITDVAVTPNPANAFGLPPYFNFTPTLSGSFTLGNGSVSGRATINGRTVSWTAAFVIGAAGWGAGSGAGIFSNPLTLLAPLSSFYVGDGIMIDSGSNRYRCEVEINTISSIVYGQDASAAAVKLLNLSSTVPFTWAAGDSVVIRGEGYLP